MRVPARPVQTVLAATDFAPEARQALARAALLARQHKADALRLVMRLAPQAAFHVLPCIAGAAGQAAARAGDRHPTQQLEQLGLRAGADERITAGVEEAGIRKELPAQADRLGADLATIGKQGQSLIADTLLGSVKSSILRGADRYQAEAARRTDHR